MDLQNITLAGLATLGVVNVIGFFKPNLDSRIKFALSFVVAFIFTFVPVELGSVLLDKVKLAIEVAFAASGGYKLFQVAGTKTGV